MGRQGSFEDQLKQKFEQQTMNAPTSVWDKVEGELNQELIATYHTSQDYYKWFAVAAMLIAIFSFSLHFIPETSMKEEVIVDAGKTYNALLSENGTFANPYQYSFFSNRSRVILVPVTIDQEESSESMLGTSRSSYEDVYVMDALQYKNTVVSMTNVNNGSIYPYLLANYNISASNTNTKKENEVWADVEAGAGNFNGMNPSDLGEINTLNLATAVGTNSFVNPSTSVNTNIETGIATTLGVGFGMKLGQKWTLESGLSYTSVDSKGNAAISVLDVYSIDVSGIDNPGIDGSQDINVGSRAAPLQVEESFNQNVDLKNNIRFTSIPVKAGYFIVDRKLSLRLNAGFSANYLVSSNLHDLNKGIINNQESELYNDWSFDGIGGLEFGYSLSNNFDFTLEPNYRHAITPLSNTLSSPSRFVIQTGFRYTLK